MSAAPRLLLASAALLLSAGFIQIHDEVVVRGIGGAIVRRHVVAPDAEELERLLDLRAKTRKEREERRASSEKLRAALCEAITSKPEMWDSCRWEGTTLIVEKRYPRDGTPFATAEDSHASFALHHYLGTPIARPPFPLLGIGPLMQDDREHRAYIADLREKGFELDLRVRMPGPMIFKWGEAVDDGSREVFVDLLDEWPWSDSILMSDRGLLYRSWFHFLLIGGAFIGLFAWSRFYRRNL